MRFFFNRRPFRPFRPFRLASVVVNRLPLWFFITSKGRKSKRIEVVRGKKKSKQTTALIVGNGPPGVHFFHTGVRRRKYKLGQTKQLW